MKKLFIRSALFLMPFGIMFILSAITMYFGGEIFGIDRAVKQTIYIERPTLFGLAYSYPVKYYKLESAKLNEAEVLIMGSSRMMQIRSNFFRNNTTFYNSGGAVNKIRFFRLFLERLEEEKRPNLLLIGLDPWWFNEKWDDLSKNQFDFDLDKPANNYRILLDNWKNVYFDLMADKLLLFHIPDKDSSLKIGFSAKMQNQGFRNDGSYFYGNFDKIKTPKENIQEEMDMLIAQEDWFLPCPEINVKAVTELAKFLNFCREKDIKVVAMLAPIAQEIYCRMSRNKKDYSNFFELSDALKPIFKEHNYSFYNYINLKDLNSNDSEMLDGTHGSEKVYLRIMVDILENDSTLGEYIDEATLTKTLKNAKSSTEVFDSYFSF